MGAGRRATTVLLLAAAATAIRVKLVVVTAFPPELERWIDNVPLGVPLPSLSAAGEEEEEKKESVVVSLSTSANADDGESGGGLYADAEERAFYEQLPDLRAVLPAVLFSEEGDADTSGLEEAMRRLPSCSSRREVDDPRLYCTIPWYMITYDHVCSYMIIYADQM